MGAFGTAAPLPDEHGLLIHLRKPTAWNPMVGAKSSDGFLLGLMSRAVAMCPPLVVLLAAIQVPPRVPAVLRGHIGIFIVELCGSAASIYIGDRPEG